LFGAVVFAASFAHAQGSPLVFCTQEIPPFATKEGGSAGNGIVADVAKMVAAELGLKYDIQFFPWNRALEMSKHGECDAIFPILKNTEREQWLNFPEESVTQQGQAFFVLKDSTVQYDGNLEKFVKNANTKFGVTTGKSYSQKFDVFWKANQIPNIDAAVSSELTASKLLGKRFDVWVENREYANYLLKKLGKTSEVKQLSPVIDEVPVYIALPKTGKLSAKGADFSTALKKLKKDGAVSKLNATYLQ
jgi:polar amino acid transport system substrate-binding protein